MMSEAAQGNVDSATEANKLLIRRLFDEVFNRGDLALVDTLWIRSELDEGKRSITDLRTAFPDYHRTIEAQVAEGDLIATRWTARGTHRGPFLSRVLDRALAPTGRAFEAPGFSLHQVADGRVVRAWVMGNDSAELLRGLGALSAQN